MTVEILARREMLLAALREIHFELRRCEGALDSYSLNFTQNLWHFMCARAISLDFVLRARLTPPDRKNYTLDNLLFPSPHARQK